MGRVKYIVQILCLIFISCDDEDYNANNVTPGIHTFNSALTFENLERSSDGQELFRSEKLTFKPLDTYLVVGGTRKLVFYGNDSIGGGELAAGPVFALIIPELIGNSNYKTGDLISTSELENYYPVADNAVSAFVSGEVSVKALNQPFPVEGTYVVLEFKQALYNTKDTIGMQTKYVELNGTLDF